MVRVLRNQADASPGGGATPSNNGSTTAAAPSGSSAPSSAPIDVSAIAEQVARQVNDSVFASLRRAGVLGSDKGAKRADAPDTGAPAPANPVGMSEEHVAKLMRLNRALGAAGLSAEQESAIEKLFKLESPDDVSGWVANTVRSLGFGKATSTPTTAPSVTTAPNPAPASNGGAPGSPAPSYDDAPWSRPQDVVDRLVREKGYPKAARELRDALQKAVRGRRFELPQGR